jgi:RND superfamily putative drug exporter
MEGLFADIESGVTEVEVVSPYEQGNAHQIAEGGTIAYAELNFSDRSFEEYMDDADIIKPLSDDAAVEGLRIELGGDMFAKAPTFSSEFIGIIAAILILLIAFGSVIAMGLPILTALFGIGTGIAVITVGARFISMPEFSTQLAAMIGQPTAVRAAARVAGGREPIGSAGIARGLGDRVDGAGKDPGMTIQDGSLTSLFEIDSLH